MGSKLDGLIAAPFTPMHADGSLNLKKIDAVAKHLIAQNIKGIFICGSTGEGPSLTIEERMQVAEAYIKASQGKLFTFIHVGHNSLYEAQKLAAHAQAIGANAISATAPTYFKIQHVKALVESLDLIAKGAPELPLYYYNIPSLTGVQLDMVHFLQQARECLPTLAGIKFTTPLLYEYQACLQFGGQSYDILYGTDEMMLGALAIGAKGFIGSTYNFMPLLYHKIMLAFRQGNIEEAQHYQAISVEVVRVIVKYGGLAAQKAMMKMIGLDCGSVRLPLVELSASQKTAMQKELEIVDFFEAIEVSDKDI